MAFNGAGVFQRLYNWVNDKNNSINITASRVDAEDDGFATGLSNCITKDGQQTVTANIPFGGYKLLNIGDATLAKDAVNSETLQSGALIWGGSVAGTNTITFSTSPSFSAYATGQAFNFIPANANTGAVTVNINGIGAIALKKPSASGLAALVANNLITAQAYTIIYDGTQFQLMSLLGGDMFKTTYDAASIAQQVVGTTATQTLTNKTLTKPNITGTATNDNAASGSVGQFVTSVIASGSPVSLTSGVVSDITSISLTGGDWDVWGNVYISNGGLNITQAVGWVSSTSATEPDTSLVAQLNTAGAAKWGSCVPQQRFLLPPGTATVYLSVVDTELAGTSTAWGGIYARRRR